MLFAFPTDFSIVDQMPAGACEASSAAFVDSVFEPAAPNDFDFSMEKQKCWGLFCKEKRNETIVWCTESQQVLLVLQSKNWSLFICDGNYKSLKQAKYWSG